MGRLGEQGVEIMRRNKDERGGCGYEGRGDTEKFENRKMEV